MDQIEAKVLPILYAVLLGFIVSNLILNLLLYSFTRIRSLKILVYYWASLICISLLQGVTQENMFLTTLAFSASIIPIGFLGKLLLEPTGVKPPYKTYALLWSLGVALTFVSRNITTTFFGLAIPVCLTVGLVLLHIAYCLSFQGHLASTRLQKFVSFLLFVSFIHTINFAIFRDQAGAQIWGWAVAFTNYQVMALSVVALIFERHARSETERLEEVVEARTQELTQALALKEKLIRIVLHDIAGPIQGQSLILSRIEAKDDPAITKSLIPKLSILTEIVRNVIQKVFTLESINSGQLTLQRSPVKLENCLDELAIVFEQRLADKEVTIEVENHLAPETYFLADQVIFTTSILGNLLSNALKFSLPGKKIVVRAHENEAEVHIEVSDTGIGIPGELLEHLFDGPQRNSRLGTKGEAGSGFGLSQVKAYLDQFGGKVSVESRAIETHPFDHGTTVHLVLAKSTQVTVINTEILR